MKKDWKEPKIVNFIQQDMIKKSQLGQLLTYMVGHCVQNCSKDYVLYEPMLGLYMEGSKVCILCIRMIAITSGGSESELMPGQKHKGGSGGSPPGNFYNWSSKTYTVLLI